ncbi:hypothetical protein V5O48_009008 [Marasmius crinis-equi]|uniref:Uncharacterized protein n=1 Tax=Marasmius crinis-equi TaxID=585013 RepID=A0ABR3FCA7_9AGAR
MPLEARGLSSIRPPSPVNRETGSFFENYPLLTIGPAEAPKVFSSCRTDIDRGTTMIKTTVEHHQGWVITTTTKLQRVHPDCWKDFLENAARQQGAEGFTPKGTPVALSAALPVGGILDASADPSVVSHTTGNSTDLSLTDDLASELGSELDVLSVVSTSGYNRTADDPPVASGTSPIVSNASPAASRSSPVASSAAAANLFNGVVDPSLIRRPVDHTTATKYYIVFVGQQIRIVRDDWPLVRRLVNGVSGGTQQGYKNFDKALLDYYCAWKGTHPNGWTLKHVPDVQETREELAGLDLDFDTLEM